MKYAKQVGEIVGEEIKPRRKINATKMVTFKRRMKQQLRQAGQREEPTVTFRCYRAGDE